MADNKLNLSRLLFDLQARFHKKLDAAAGGPKIVGALCLSSPLELVDCLGAIPLRLMPASHEAELRGGRFISSDSCSFCQAVLGGLDRSERKPDAVLGATTCDQMRRNLEIIERDLNIPTFICNSPRTAGNDLSREFAGSELQRLAAELSAWAGAAFDFDRLAGAIARRQSIRRRLADLSRLTINENAQPALSGSEFFALMRLYQTTSLDYFESCLPEIETLAASSQRTADPAPLRLALLGSCIGEGDDQIIQLIEESGRAIVVYDAICTGRMALRDAAGTGAMNASPPLAEDPFEALLELYHDQIQCPHRRPNDALFEMVAIEVQRLQVQGVVYKTLKFCHPWGFEAKRFKDLLDLPFLQLDHDLSDSAIGQMRTRIGAFLEQLNLRRHRDF